MKCGIQLVGLLGFAIMGSAATASECDAIADQQAKVACEDERYARAKANPDFVMSDPDSFDSPSKAICKRRSSTESSTDQKVAVYVDCLKREKEDYDAQLKAHYAIRQEADRLDRERREEEARKQREIAEAESSRREKAARIRRTADAEKAKAEAAQRAAEAKAKDDALIAACGSDYKQVRIGMTVGRAQQCVAPFKLTGQFNRVDGVIIDSYQHCRGYNCTYLSVIDGRIAAWTN